LADAVYLGGMKAVFITGKGHPNKAFEWLELPVPQPGAGEVRIHVSHSGLNFADVMMRKGLYRGAPPLPYVPGYDVAGTVDAVGAGVDASWIGKPVFALTRFGGYAEYAVTKAEGVAEIPASMDAATATALATQYCTALYAMRQCPNLRTGHAVLIHAAAGGVGTALVQLALHMGLEVFGTAGSDAKINRLRDMGVHHPINYRQQPYGAAVAATGKKLMAVFNPIGGKSFKHDRPLLAPGGQHILFGGADRAGGKAGIFSTLGFVQRMGLLIPIALMMKSQGITGVNMLHIGDHHPQLLAECLQEVRRLAGEGVLKPHVHAVYDTAQLHQAHLLLEQRDTMGKLVMRW
jgi:NADPH2:quinone reductase